jgi:DNA-binding LacI/PurR family transcriptional regulator
VNSEAPRSGLPAITSDNRGGARLAADHLIGLGHTRLAHITAPAANAAAAARLLGVRDALRHAGLDPDCLQVVEGDGRVAGGERAMLQLLGGSVIPTGVVCYNDLTAIGAMRAVTGAGLSVPDDVSLVGFDDIELAQWTDPPLTTVAQPKREMGAWAFARLAGSDQESQSQAGARTVRLATRLILRGSTGPRAA